MRTSLLCLGALLLVTSCGRRSLLSAEADFDPIDDAQGDSGTDAGLPPCGFGPPCDPTNLGGMTCEKLGLPRGTLTCEATSCELDISQCRSAAPPTGTGTPIPGTPGGTTPPTFFGGASDAGLFGGNFFGGGMGAMPPDEDAGTADEDAGGSGPGPGAPGGAFPGGNFFGGGTGGTGGLFGGNFFGGGFFGGGTGGTGGGFFGGGFFGGGTGGSGTGGSGG
jgi:hypothetical protein